MLGLKRCQVPKDYFTVYSRKKLIIRSIRSKVLINLRLCSVRLVYIEFRTKKHATHCVLRFLFLNRLDNCAHCARPPFPWQRGIHA